LKGNDEIRCNCQESIYHDFPCKHEVSVCAQDLKDHKFLRFEKRWRKYYFNINDDENEDIINNGPNPSQGINFQIEERKEMEIIM